MARLASVLVSNVGATLLLVVATGAGALLGVLSPSLGQTLGGCIDATVLAFVFLLFVELRIDALGCRWGNLRLIAICWISNFLVVPVIGFAIASLFMAGKPLLFTGLLIYFVSPCTDWFLGFTRLAKGNTSLGAVLIPIYMISQLLLYPLYLCLFTIWRSDIDIATGGDTILHWFVLPTSGAIALRLVTRLALPAGIAERTPAAAGRMIPFLLAILVFEIFAAYIPVIAGQASDLIVILFAVASFFAVTFAVAEGVSRLFRLGYPDHALLTMTTAARNAPLMLGVITVAIPNQPVIYAALIIGMLAEFPHLIALKHLLLVKRGNREASVPRPLDARRADARVDPVELGAPSGAR